MWLSGTGWVWQAPPPGRGRAVRPVRQLRCPLSLLLLAARSRILVGGQAVIEGVMMRVPGVYAVALEALKAAFGDRLKEVEGRQYMAEAIA